MEEKEKNAMQLRVVLNVCQQHYTFPPPVPLALPLCNMAKQKLRVEIVEIISLSGVLAAGAIDVTRGQCRFRKRVSRLCKYSPKQSQLVVRVEVGVEVGVGVGGPNLQLKLTM